MLDPRSPFMAAVLKSQETRLAGREHLESVLTAGSARDALGTLAGTDIGAWLQGEEWADAAELDRLIWRYLSDEVLAFETQHFFPWEARRYCRAWLLRYDVANLKAVLQALTLGRAPVLLPIGVLHELGRLEAVGAARSIEEVIEHLTHRGLQAFVPVLRAVEPTGRRKSRLAVESALEAAAFGVLLRRIRHMAGANILLVACGLMVDLANLSLLCRLLISGHGTAVQQAFIPGGHLLHGRALEDALTHGWRELPRRLGHELFRKITTDVVAAYERSESIAVLDLVIEKHRLALMRELLAPELAPAAVMAWFLVLKEAELRGVRLLLAAAEDGLAREDAVWALLV